MLTQYESQSAQSKLSSQKMVHILLSSSVVSVLDAKLEVATMDRTMTEEKRIMCEDVIWDQINMEG
jgi:hypothetical protein